MQLTSVLCSHSKSDMNTHSVIRHTPSQCTTDLITSVAINVYIPLQPSSIDYLTLESSKLPNKAW